MTATTVQRKPVAGGSRMAARELILRALYSDLCGGDAVGDADDAHLVRRADLRWRDRMLKAIAPHKAALDDLIAEQAGRHPTDIDHAELCILRLACHELEHSADVPWKVVIDESVRLAHLYCGPDSYRFVNGVAERLAVRFRPADVAKQ